MYNPEIDWYNYDGNIIDEEEMKEEIHKEVRSMRPYEFVRKVVNYGNPDDYFDPLYDYVMEAFAMDELIEMMHMPACKIDLDEGNDF